jgi:hypothetical protein
VQANENLRQMQLTLAEADAEAGAKEAEEQKQKAAWGTAKATWLKHAVLRHQQSFMRLVLSPA